MHTSASREAAKECSPRRKPWVPVLEGLSHLLFGCIFFVFGRWNYFAFQHRGKPFKYLPTYTGILVHSKPANPTTYAFRGQGLRLASLLNTAL
jgi:hypothetical protein